MDRRIWTTSKAAITLLVLSPAILWGQAVPSRLEDRNVVYGMVSGLALLMDVHRSEKTNGLGIVAITGTGFHIGGSYDAPPMKERQEQLGGR